MAKAWRSPVLSWCATVLMLFYVQSNLTIDVTMFENIALVITKWTSASTLRSGTKFSLMHVDRLQRRLSSPDSSGRRSRINRQRKPVLDNRLQQLRICTRGPGTET